MSHDPTQSGSRVETPPKLQVLALGMPRTGTFSLANALEILDLPCYHGFTLIANFSADPNLWNQALDWKLFNIPIQDSDLSSAGGGPNRAFWTKLFGDHRSVADLPAIIFAEELVNAFPESKVVLVERDIERWYPSFESAVINNVWSPVVDVIRRIDPVFLSRLHSVSWRWTKGYFKANSKTEMQQNARRKYKEHYDLVRRVTPAGRLLEFDLKDGWAPLCEFLGKDIPNVPFPRTNDSAALQKLVNGYMRTGLMNAAIKAFPLALAAALAVLATVWLGG